MATQRHMTLHPVALRAPRVNSKKILNEINRYLQKVSSCCTNKEMKKHLEIKGCRDVCLVMQKSTTGKHAMYIN